MLSIHSVVLLSDLLPSSLIFRSAPLRLSSLSKAPPAASKATVWEGPSINFWAFYWISKRPYASLPHWVEYLCLHTRALSLMPRSTAWRRWGGRVVSALRMTYLIAAQRRPPSATSWGLSFESFSSAIEFSIRTMKRRWPAVTTIDFARSQVPSFSTPQEKAVFARITFRGKVYMCIYRSMIWNNWNCSGNIANEGSTDCDNLYNNLQITCI